MYYSHLIIDQDGVNNWYALIDPATPFFPIGSTGDDTFWELNGHLHRVGNPAVERPNGTKLWYQHGLLHRLDGPAVEFADGNKYWYQHGLCHRECGPAVRHSNGDKFWFINGHSRTEEEVRMLAFVNSIPYIDESVV